MDTRTVVTAHVIFTNRAAETLSQRLSRTYVTTRLLLVFLRFFAIARQIDDLDNALRRVVVR